MRHAVFVPQCELLSTFSGVILTSKFLIFCPSSNKRTSLIITQLLYSAFSKIGYLSFVVSLLNSSRQKYKRFVLTLEKVLNHLATPSTAKRVKRIFLYPKINTSLLDKRGGGGGGDSTTGGGKMLEAENTLHPCKASLLLVLLLAVSLFLSMVQLVSLICFL